MNNVTIEKLDKGYLLTDSSQWFIRKKAFDTFDEVVQEVSFSFIERKVGEFWEPTKEK